MMVYVEDGIVPEYLSEHFKMQSKPPLLYAIAAETNGTAYMPFFDELEQSAMQRFVEKFIHDNPIDGIYIQNEGETVMEHEMTPVE